MKMVVMALALFNSGCSHSVIKVKGLARSFDAEAEPVSWYENDIYFADGLTYSFALPEEMKGGDCVMVAATVRPVFGEDRVYVAVRKNQVPLERGRWSTPHAYAVFSVPEYNFDTAVFVTRVGSNGFVHLSAFLLSDRVCRGSYEDPSDNRVNYSEQE